MIPISVLPLNALIRTPMESDVAAQRLRELTAGLAIGNDDAWARFHGEYGPGLFRHLLAAAWGDYDLASEALQQSYLRIARYARSCESEAMFRGWLRRVTQSALHDCRRRRWSFWNLLRRSGNEAEPGPDPSAEAADARLFAALDAALVAMPPDDRALLEAKYFSGRDVRSIAADLALSPKAVESRLTRARAEMRLRLVEILRRHG